jgi:hypothetical protein
MPAGLWRLGYENICGIWLDEGPRSLKGTVDLGGDSIFPLVGHGWTGPKAAGGETRFRLSTVPRSWLRIPIRTAGPFEVTLKARSWIPETDVTLTLEAGGVPAGSVVLTEDWRELSLSLPAASVRSGLNTLSLHFSPTPVEVVPGFRGKNAAAAVAWLRFRRLDRRASAGPEGGRSTGSR